MDAGNLIMTMENYLLPDALLDYSRRVGLRESDLLRELREETSRFPGKNMQIPPELGQFLGLLVELTGARKILELGSFTGYSALAMALAMPPGGRLVACDGNEPAQELARRYWARAGIAERIELRVGECADSLDELRDEGNDGSFDLAFIDADKPGYAGYYECCMALLRVGGVMVFDNVFMGGDVLADQPDGKYTASVQAFNLMMRDDQRISISMLPLGDGITLARKRA